MREMMNSGKRYCQASGQQYAMSSGCLILALAISLPVAAQSPSTRENLDAVRDFLTKTADAVCNDVPMDGSNRKIDLAMKAKADASRIVQQIGKINAEVGGKFEQEAHSGLLQKDLGKAYQDRLTCKQELVKSLLPYVERTSQGSGGSTMKAPVPARPGSTAKPLPKTVAAPQDSKCQLAPERYFPSRLSYDTGTMLQEWSPPVVWAPGTPAINLPINSSAGFGNIEQFSVGSFNNNIGSTLEFSLSQLQKSGLDASSKRIIKEQLGELKSGTTYKPRLGLVTIYPRQSMADDSQPYFGVRLLSEWQREAFNRELVRDYHLADGAKYCGDRQKWLDGGIIEFPSFIYSEFAIISSDGYVIVRIKRPHTDGSQLANVQGKDVYIASSEVPLEISKTTGQSDILFNPSNPLAAYIDLNRTFERGLRNDLGLDAGHIKQATHFGMAFQMDSMNSALLSVVQVDLSCEELKTQARRVLNRDIQCIARPDAIKALDGKSNTIFDAPEKSAWHPTGRLRLHYWLRGVRQ